MNELPIGNEPGSWKSRPVGFTTYLKIHIKDYKDIALKSHNLHSWVKFCISLVEN